MNRMYCAWCLAAFLSVPHTTALAQEPPQKTPAAEAAIPKYSDSKDGLTKLAKDMLDFEKKSGEVTLAPYVNSLVLPNPDPWFRSVFGDARGAQFASDYQKSGGSIPPQMATTIAGLVRDKLNDVVVLRFEKACAPLANETEYPVLILRERPEPLYEVRFLGSGGKGRALAFFAYAEGAFRYLGKVSDTREVYHVVVAAEEKSPLRVRIGGNVAVARIIHQVQPHYPPEAKTAHLQGKVTVHAIIAKDGSIRDLDLVQGVCPLSKAAIEAIQHLRYQSFLLNGQPVEVGTTITVVFTLGD